MFGTFCNLFMYFRAKEVLPLRVVFFDVVILPQQGQAPGPDGTEGNLQQLGLEVGDDGNAHHVDGHVSVREELE